MNRTSGNYGTAIVININKLEIERRGYRKILEATMVKMFKFNENYEHTNPRSLMNPKHKKHEESCTEAHCNQVANTSDENKILKSTENKGITDRGTQTRMTANFCSDPS